VIDVRDLVVRYGSATALDGVSLEVHPGERVALVGPNGAGKSTLVNTLSKIVRPSGGRVTIKGRLSHVPEGRQLFPDLTVDDNLMLGAWKAGDRDTAWVYALLPALEPKRKQRASTLSGGQQQMVAFGRALMSRPDVMVVDELSLGLAPIIVADLVRHLEELNTTRGLAVLLIEQNARLALELCTRAYVIEAGRIVAEGPSVELSNSAELAKAYLGGPLEESS
jgi:branched-chain amino acid transport system ATP-binding protein